MFHVHGILFCDVLDVLYLFFLVFRLVPSFRFGSDLVVRGSCCQVYVLCIFFVVEGLCCFLGHLRSERIRLAGRSLVGSIVGLGADTAVVSIVLGTVVGIAVVDTVHIAAVVLGTAVVRTVVAVRTAAVPGPESTRN